MNFPLEHIFEPSLIRIIAASVMLALGVAWDLKAREIPDMMWIVFAVVAAVLAVIEINNPVFAINLALSTIILIPLSYFLWKFGIFGGADAFCLMVFSALVPLTTLSSNPITPFTIIINSCLLALVMLFFNVAKNLALILKNQNIFEGFDESRLRKINALFLGTYQYRPKFSFAMEKTVNGVRKFDFSLKNAESTDYCSVPNTWTTQGLPFLVFISGGFFVQIFFGDVLLLTLEHFHIL